MALAEPALVVALAERALPVELAEPALAVELAVGADPDPVCDPPQLATASAAAHASPHAMRLTAGRGPR